MRERVLTLKTRTVVSPSCAGTRPCSIANGADAGQHVAAVGPRVDRLLADADLREQVVDVAARLRRLRDDRDLAGQRAAAADAVDLQQVGRADGADQHLVARGVVGGQPFAQEERAARGAGTHQDAGDGSVHGAMIGAGHCKSELHL